MANGQANLADFLEGELTSTIDTTMYVSEYNEGGPSNELKVVFRVNINSDGTMTVEISDNQEGGGQYVSNTDHGLEIYEGSDYSEAKKQMEDYFYGFYGEQAIKKSGNGIKTSSDFKQRVVREASAADTDEDEEIKDKREESIRKFRDELRERRDANIRRRNVAQESITDSNKEIDSLQDRINQLQQRKDDLIQEGRDLLEEGRRDDAQKKFGSTGPIQQQINQINRDIQEERRAKQDDRETISEANRRIERINRKLSEVNSSLENN